MRTKGPNQAHLALFLLRPTIPSTHLLASDALHKTNTNLKPHHLFSFSSPLQANHLVSINQSFLHWIGSQTQQELATLSSCLLLAHHLVKLGGVGFCDPADAAAISRFLARSICYATTQHGISIGDTIKKQPANHSHPLIIPP